LENAPTVIAESLVRGIPVLASRVGGVPEMVEEGRSGWMFEAGNEVDFFDALIRASAEIQNGFRMTPATDDSREPYLKTVLDLINK